jgi:hypothetical protein
MGDLFVAVVDVSARILVDAHVASFGDGRNDGFPQGSDLDGFDVAATH